jgi:chemotaxis signal transduction protein/HPt (histidine-containing phosphotransfer) domain-containing protein
VGEFDDLIGEFVTESREHIADIEEDLIKIEAEMENVDPEVINRVFRAAHSIKGSAKFLDLVNIGELAHKLEDVLNLIRAGKVLPPSDVANPLLQSADMLKSMLEDVTSSNDMDISEQLDQLQDIISGAGSAQASRAKTAPVKKQDLLSCFSVDHRALSRKVEQSQVFILHMMIKKGNYDEVMSDLGQLGEVMAVSGTGRDTYAILFSTIIEPDMLPIALKIDADSFTQVRADMLAGAKPAQKQEARPPEPTAPRPGVEQAPAARPVEKKVRREIEEDLDTDEDELEKAPAPAKERIRLKEAEERKEENTSFITFSIEDETYAVPIQAIEEIIGCQEISLLPNVPDFIKGVINLRGDLVPIMDLRLKFGLEAREYNPLTVFLIVRVDDKVMGLVVDNVADVLVIDPARVQKTPVFSAKISTDFIEGVYKDTQNQMVILVNVAALTKPEEWELIAA